MEFLQGTRRTRSSLVSVYILLLTSPWEFGKQEIPLLTRHLLNSGDWHIPLELQSLISRAGLSRNCLPFAWRCLFDRSLTNRRNSDHIVLWREQEQGGRERGAGLRREEWEASTGLVVLT